VTAVHHDTHLQQAAAADYASVLELTRQLVRTPSRGGLDSYDAVIAITEGWLRAAGTEPQVLTRDAAPVAVVCDVVGEEPGPHYVLDACLDTADIGDELAWSFDPFGAQLEHGWLYGRGTSDSKVAVAIFSHLAARLASTPASFAGRLSVLFDLDEHTGGFAGIRSFLERPDNRDLAGVMIGYPGCDSIVIGGRGFLRARFNVFGNADHSASRRTEVSNAVVRASQLATILTGATPADVDPDYGLPPKLTVTAIHGGTSGVYSVVPDRCQLEVDVRLTSTFDEATAWDLLTTAARVLDDQQPASRTTLVERTAEAWPPFRLPPGHELEQALRTGARSVGLDPRPVVAGPSNIGNLLATRGLPATAGFGVRYRNLHGTDETIEVATIPAVQAAYHRAVLELLRPGRLTGGAEQ
jgi:succinyl-diaminopimelate desuccinylase